MKQAREIATCTRCRLSKRRCDKTKPGCIRCERGGAPCTYESIERGSIHSTQVSPQDGNRSSSHGESEQHTSAIPPPTPELSNQHHRVRKRNRACLSCTRCHRLKVRCNQKDPCDRCMRSGVQATCTYTSKKTSKEPAASTQSFGQPNPEVPFALTGEDPEFVVATWYLRKRGSTHFRAILNRMESLSSLQSTPFSISVKQHIEGHCSSDFALPSNYPFGSSSSARYITTQGVHELLHRFHADIASFVDGYFQTFHPSLPVFDETSFRSKLVHFWNDLETADLIWLAQCLAVFGIGAYTTNSDAVAAELLYASEACLARTTYMARPTTTAISTLCLMVVAKQATTATCWTLDTCWNVMGVILRLSMMTVLHKQWMPGYDEQVIVRERMSRHRLWTLIVYLDTQMSLRTGQQSMLPPNTLHLYTDNLDGDCWDTIVPRALPVVCEFLSRINAYDGEIFSYDEVLGYDREITQLMHEAAAFYKDDAVHLTLDIFFRRALLAVHCQYALRLNASVLFPVSYNSTFDINLALLNHYHRLSVISPHTHLLAKPYMLDFLAAAFTTCMLLLSPDGSSSCDPSCSMINEDTGLTYRQTMLDALMRCMDILAMENKNVLCFSTGFKQLKAMYELTLQK